MLWRSRMRTWLTFLSIVVAFLLFGVLQSVNDAFQLGVRLAGDDRLIVSYKQGLIKLLPIAYRSRIEAVDPEGILVAQPVMFLGGAYQDPKNPMQIIAIDPATLRIADPRVLLPDDQFHAFQATRTGLLAGRDLAEKFGWKVGDRIPILSGVQRKDGGSTWDFELVGIYELDEKIIGRRVPAQFMVMQLEHYNEAAQFGNLVVWYTVRVRDAGRAPAIAKAIDDTFRNSEFETKTQSEADFQRGFLKQLGSVGKMMTAILGAVFFTLLLVAGNTMMQAFRERTGELAVLKTLGFANGQLAILISAESVLLCVFAGAVGLTLAAVLFPLLPLNLGGGGGPSGLQVEQATLLLGVGLALTVGALSAVVPAWRSARLSVVDALVQA